jgi:hypothetical protein
MPYFQKKDVANYFIAVKDCPAFAEAYNPDDIVKEDGIYGCGNDGCQYEVVRHKGEALPHEPTCASHLSGVTFRAMPGEPIVHLVSTGAGSGESR